MTTYFGFAVADSMFPGECTIHRRSISPEQFKSLITEGVVPCVNPSHEATVHLLKTRFGIDVAVPSTPPRVALKPGDRLLVMSVRGLPRLTDRHQYTQDEIDRADISFALYEVG